MFDYTGEAEPGDPILSILSWILLIISSAAILITQFLLLHGKVQGHSQCNDCQKVSLTFCEG